MTPVTHWVALNKQPSPGPWPTQAPHTWVSKLSCSKPWSPYLWNGDNNGTNELMHRKWLHRVCVFYEYNDLSFMSGPSLLVSSYCKSQEVGTTHFWFCLHSPFPTPSAIKCCTDEEAGACLWTLVFFRMLIDCIYTSRLSWNSKMQVSSCISFCWFMLPS